MPMDPGDVQRLRTALRDLVALSSIPAVWVGREPPTIAAGLADVLVGSLHLDFAFVRLCDPNGGAVVDVTRGDAWKAFPEWLERHLAAVGRCSRKEIIPDVGGGMERCRGLVIPIGVNADGGLVAVACDRVDFPTETDQLLLSVAANHAATAFQNARLIHERRRAEEELRQARDELEMKVTERTDELRRTTAELQTILDASPIGIVLFRRDRTVQRCNPAFERLVGWKADEIVGRRIPLPETIEKWWTPLVTRLDRGEGFSGREIRIMRKDGSEFDATLACAPLADERGRAAGFVANIEDIGDRKRAEEALRRSETYLAEAQRLSHTGSWARDIATGQQTHSSEEHSRLFGFDPQTDRPSSDEFHERVHPDDRGRVAEIVEKAARERMDYELDYRVVLPNGTMKCIHAVGHPVFSASGDPVQFVGTAMDVTERRRAEEERQAHLWFLESMDQVNRAIQGTNDLEQMMSDVLDAVLSILNCDRSWLVYPCDPEAASWKVPMEHARPEFPGAFALGLDLPVDPEIAKAFQTVRASSSPVRFGPASEHPLPAEAAKRFRIQSMIAMAIHPKGDKPYMFGLHQCSYPRAWTPQEERLFQEIGRRLEDALTSLLMFRTQIGQFIERKQAEDALHHAQAELAHVTRVATLGEMTASIAHEINQPLAAVVNNATACLHWLAAQNLEEARQSAEFVIADGHRAGEIIDRIRALAKKAPARRDWVDVNETILEVIALARREVQSNGVSLRTRLGDDLPLVLGDRIQLQQVILNLMINAIEAMTGISDAPRELLIASAKDNSQSVLVAVRDSGPGLPPGSLDRLFHAFYTTKPHGMGMGLAISRSIVEAHGGRLWATANVPHGAVFQFMLPIGGEKVA